MDELLPHQQRVVDEKIELDNKIQKLDTFQRSDTFAKLSTEEIARLNRQMEYMSMYSAVLAERINAF